MQVALVVLVAGLLAFPATVRAHEKWFYDATLYPTRWEQAFQFPGIVGVAVAVGLTVMAGVAWRARRGRDLLPGPPALGAMEAGRARFYALVPFILGIHVGLPLIVLGIRGELFSPNNGLEGASRHWLGLAEIGIGVSVLYGALTRLASAVLAGTWIVGIGLIGLEPMLENLHYLGFAAFFFLTGRGPYAIDRLLFPALEPPPAFARRAITTLRVAMGLSLSVVAFTEKLANPQLALAFLQHYPLNFTPWLGLPMSDERFALCAGATELVIGLWTVFGLFPRVIIATAWIFINMTLTVFNWVELLGHLPLYGVMAVLLVWTPTEEDQRLWVRGVLGHDPSARAEQPSRQPT
jgi:uncharacterized membrane protein YphA (DoxX/SURF4 family)